MSVRDIFDAGAERYDQARHQLVPGFDEFYGAAVAAIPYVGEEEIGVLDLGAGTGLLSAMVADRFPRARVTLLDFSTEMLEVARRRFGPSSSGESRFEFRVADYSEEALPEGREVIVSALSIHHLGDREKRMLFRRVYEALPGGGVFVNADQVAGETPEAEASHQEEWLRRVREAGVGEEDLAASLERTKQDKNAPLASQMAWLAEAGFEKVSSHYEDHRFAVYSGCKPEEQDINAEGSVE